MIAGVTPSMRAAADKAAASRCRIDEGFDLLQAVHSILKVKDEMILPPIFRDSESRIECVLSKHSSLFQELS
jgi:hypothetical protein